MDAKSLYYSVEKEMVLEPLENIRDTMEVQRWAYKCQLFEK